MWVSPGWGLLLRCRGGHALQEAASPDGGHSGPLLLSHRPFMPNLVPPKIPDGERVDFDVSGGCGEGRPGWGGRRGPDWKVRPYALGVGRRWPGRVSSKAGPQVRMRGRGLPPLPWSSGAPTGHPPEAHGEGPE